MTPIANSSDCAIIIPLTQAEAKRLADLHLALAQECQKLNLSKRLSDVCMALAQEYRKLAGMEPVQTKHAERHPERLKPLALDAHGKVRR
jgi:hypothetical protein